MGKESLYNFGPGHMTKMATWPYMIKSLKKSFYTPIYVTGYQFNGPSGLGYIANQHFGTVTLSLQ